MMAEDYEDGLYRFLEKREVPASLIENMKSDKIDTEVIKLMTDKNLAKYLPSYGDRLAVMDFCKSLGKSADKRKTDLLMRLQKKLRRRPEKNISGSESDDERPGHRQNKLTGNANACKVRRKIEIGWLHYTDRKWKSVRAKDGGGTRRLCVKKNSSVEDLLPIAQDLFFPGGVSVMGPISDFSLHIRDFQQEVLEDGLSVGTMYQETKLPVLRFYLATKSKVKENKTDMNKVAITDDSNHLQEDLESEEFPFPDPFLYCESEVEVQSIPPVASQVEVVTDVAIIGENSPSSSGIISFGSNHHASGDYVDLDDTIPYEESKAIRLHRGSILTEMVDNFMDESIMTKFLDLKIINNNGEEEKAVGTGVIKDALTEFWEEFYSGYTTGVNSKIPYLRHDMSDSKWRAVGRILVKGWYSCRYFPVLLSTSFLEQVIFDEVLSDITQNFFEYIPDIERETLLKAMHDFPTGSEYDELLDTLSNYNCRRSPNASNFLEILKEIAHKELLQESRFVSDCWREVCRPLRKEFHGVGGIGDLLTSLKITNKRVLKALNFPEVVSESEMQVKKYLKRFVSELSVEDLRKFSRFCTGTDIMSYDKLFVRFATFESDLARRPIAHTCGNVLELPHTYDNYPQFRSEFLSILKCCVWDMDIV
ncbi:hypothetical protein BSL78_18305 [Apostichopus japonicus]|uniref:HECT domain-containing protein n=1 Tax=Stichopus japonicus TaxID=307972 RepID=A0A2G8K9Y9_STIJA|nr:hypothetical protein BSL78_18305 [Apostichopus japonicus]